MRLLAPHLLIHIYQCVFTSLDAFMVAEWNLHARAAKAVSVRVKDDTLLSVSQLRTGDVTP